MEAGQNGQTRASLLEPVGQYQDEGDAAPGERPCRGEKAGAAASRRCKRQACRASRRCRLQPSAQHAVLVERGGRGNMSSSREKEGPENARRRMPWGWLAAAGRCGQAPQERAAALVV